jgi:thymidylate synthase
MYVEFDNLDQSIIGLSFLVFQEGKWRNTRGFRCLELNQPILIKITNPTDRYCTIKERKWNNVLPFVESLFLALGINSLDALPGNYVKSLYNYSDDGHTWRAAYSPRLRYWLGIDSDYNISNRQESKIYSGFTNFTDQLKFVIDKLKFDIESRQAGITIHDPSKDDFDRQGNLKTTKDQPCTRLLQFQVMDGKLDLTVFLRSNDLHFGYSAVNFFNFTFIQEYIANVLGVEVGNYYHIANNLHIYEDKLELTKKLAFLNVEDYPTGEKYQYKDKIADLSHFDSLIDNLYEYEQNIRLKSQFFPKNFGNDLFNDWGKVFLQYWSKQKQQFINPYLNRLFNGCL